MSPLVAALVVAVAAFLVSGWWFGVHRRRLAETEAGVAALAGMKWRECAGIVLQALEGKGYKELPSSRQPGDGGTEFLLVKGDERCLLSYKHGTAYRLGEANVRDFANAVQLQGATSGILVTLGTAEAFARDIARRYGVELIDGRNLWPQVEPFAPATIVASIRTHAAEHIRRGQRLGLAASLALGLVVFLFGTMMQSSPPDVIAGTASVAGSATTAEGGTPTSTAEFTDPATRDANAALRELEQVALLSEDERNDRRVTAAASVSSLRQVETAIWSTQSTLVIRMKETDGVDDLLVTDVCGILANFEEIRYSRLQLEPPVADAETTPIRWRVCQ